jgi:predicted nucleotidyltransferase
MVKKNDPIRAGVLFFLNEVKRKYSIDKAYIFGSYAKGKATNWSDIDLAIVSRDFSDEIFNDRLYLMNLSSQFDDRIEPVLYSPSTFILNDPLVAEICKNGVQVI